MNILIKNGRVLDPATGKDGIYDILVTDNIITKVESNIDEDAIKRMVPVMVAGKTMVLSIDFVSFSRSKIAITGISANEPSRKRVPLKEKAPIPVSAASVCATNAIPQIIAARKSVNIDFGLFFFI